MPTRNDNIPALSKSFDDKLFQLLVANVEDYGIFMIDPNGIILSWNQGAENIKGYTETEVIGKHISLFYTPEDIEKNIARKNLNEALKKGSYESEGWRIRKDGSKFWANVTFTTLYNDNGHLVGFAKITRDVTERKKIEDEKAAINIELEKRVKENTERIIANELRFRKLIENSHEGISLLDKDLNVIYRSPSSERINGFSTPERNEIEIDDLIHPDDRPLVKQLFEEINAKPGLPIQATYRTKHKLGHYIWVECLYTNMLDNITIGAIVCNFRDITERKTAERELKNKTEQIENILESITDGFIALDNDLRYTYANKKMGEMLECDPQSLIGKYVWDIFPDAINSETAQAFNTALKEQQYIYNEDYYAPLNLWQENHIYPSVNGLSVFIRDISERKVAELEIQYLNETLEKKVIERTAQMELANKDLESFSYSVSHDLRTPLRAINGYANMLKEDFEDKLSDEGNRIINTITDNARLMGQLIDDLLSFSRIGRKEIAIGPVNMYTHVKSCFRQLFENGPQKYQVVIHPLQDCEADSSMIKQVWMNLIGNAIKYTSKTEAPTIEIGFIGDKKKRTYFVKDNGVGFDMQYSDKLFGVFQRLHRNDEFEGTGVGLALSKRIIDKHGGKIWAEAEVGKGATFYFSLPSQKLPNLKKT
jgi:PAS domain S-box-containing protein